MKHILDARGLTCPLPVINTKKELEGVNIGENIEVIVDNEIAVQNLTKFANVQGFPVSSSKVSDDEFHVNISKGEKAVEEEEVICEPSKKDNFVIVISSDKMGEGNEVLGHKLLKAFIFAVTKQDKLPKTMLFYNMGAHMTCEGSEVLEDLKLLESEGVEIMTCGTCLDFYGIKEKLCVGTVTNMYDIAETMEKAYKIIKPW